MCDEFAQVFELCVKVLQEATKPSLIKATLETFLRFLSWVPLGYIFETNIIDILVSRVSCYFPGRVLSGLGFDRGGGRHGSSF